MSVMQLTMFAFGDVAMACMSISAYAAVGQYRANKNETARLMATYHIIFLAIVLVAFGYLQITNAHWYWLVILLLSFAFAVRVQVDMYQARRHQEPFQHLWPIK